MTDFEYREVKVQDWLNELETKYSKDYSTKLEEKLKKIKDIKDLENIDIDIDISEDLINFHILGKYLAVMELKTDFKKEFAKNDDVFSMPFKKAVEEMKKRKPILFKDLETTEKQEKENHFWIKKTTNLNITKDIYTKLIKSLEQGNTSDTFIKYIVSDYKLPKGYLEGVYRTVTTQAQQRGHLEQQLNMIDLGYKYGMFTSVLDGRETHKCHNMNGKILPIKEFIEKGLYPPLHYRCRSSIIQLDDDDLKDMNLKVTENIEENPNRFSDYRKNESYLELFNKKKEEVNELKEVVVNIEKERKNYKISDDALIKKYEMKTFDIFGTEPGDGILTPTEYHEMQRYTGDAYKIINRYLRGEIGVGEYWDEFYEEYFDIEKSTQIIKNVLKNNSLEDDLYLYRGGGIPEIEYIRKNKEFNNFISSSLFEDVAKEFMEEVEKKGEESWEIIIKAPKGTKGLYINGKGAYADEKEFVMNVGQKYRILKEENKKIFLEVIIDE